MQWSLIALGFSLLCSLALFLNQLHGHLVNPKPRWVGTDDAIVSVYRQNVRGDYAYSSKAQLDRLQRAAEVESFAELSFASMTFRIAEQYVEAMPVVYFSDNLPTLLAPPEPLASYDHHRDGIYISDWLWQSLDRPALNGLYMELVQSAKWRFPVIGVLPPAMNSIGKQRPGVWLPYQLKYTYTALRNNEAPADVTNPKILALSYNFGSSVGFAKLRGQFDVTALAQRLDSLPIEWYGNAGYRPTQEQQQSVLIAGIELKPEQRGLLLKQWWLLTGLTLLFALIVGLNLVVSLLGQLLKRSHEISMRRLFGADLMRLCRQCLMEQVPLMAITVIGGVIGYVLLQLVVTELHLFQRYFGSHGMPLRWSECVIAIFCMIVFIGVCSLLPLLLLLKRIGFYRSRQAQHHRWQLWALRGQLLLQVAMAGYALVLALALQSVLWQQQTQLKAFNHIEIKARFTPAARFDERLAQGKLGPLGPAEVAISGGAFDQEYTQFYLSWQDSPEQTVHSFMQMVSENYLSLLAAKLLAGELTLRADHVVLSQHLADLLRKPGQSYADMIGQNLVANAPMPTQVRISGIVADLPHRGIHTESIPMIYQRLKANPYYDEASFHLLVKPALENAGLTALDDWAYQHGLDVEVTPKPALQQQLRRLNEGYWLITQIASVKALLITLLVVVNMYYQVVAQLRLQQQRLGTMLAVGASPAVLVTQLCIQHTLLFALSCVLILCAWFATTPWIHQQLSIALTLPSQLPWLGSALLLVLLFATWLPARAVLKQPIQRLLQSC